MSKANISITVLGGVFAMIAYIAVGIWPMVMSPDPDAIKNFASILKVSGAGMFLVAFAVISILHMNSNKDTVNCMEEASVQREDLKTLHKEIKTQNDEIITIHKANAGEIVNIRESMVEHFEEDIDRVKKIYSEIRGVKKMATDNAKEISNIKKELPSYGT